MDNHNLHDVLFGFRLSRHVQSGSIQLMGLPLEAEEVQDSPSSYVLHSGYRAGHTASVLQHLVLLHLERKHRFFRLPHEASSQPKPRRHPVLDPVGARTQNQLEHQINI